MASGLSDVETTNHVAVNPDVIRRGDLVVVRYESDDGDYGGRPDVLVLISSTNGVHLNVVNWRAPYTDSEQRTLQQTLDTLDLRDHDPRAVVETFRRVIGVKVSGAPLSTELEPLARYAEQAASLHLRPSASAIRNALIEGSVLRRSRRYRGASCCDGLITNNHYFWSRWPDFCSSLPDLAPHLIDFLLSKGTMYCPDCHGIEIVRALVRQTLYRREMYSLAMRSLAQLMDQRDDDLPRSRRALGYTSDRQGLRTLTLKCFDDYFNGQVISTRSHVSQSTVPQIGAEHEQQLRTRNLLVRNPRTAGFTYPARPISHPAIDRTIFAEWALRHVPNSWQSEALVVRPSRSGASSWFQDFVSGTLISTERNVNRRATADLEALEEDSQGRIDPLERKCFDMLTPAERESAPPTMCVRYASTHSEESRNLRFCHASTASMSNACCRAWRPTTDRAHTVVLHSLRIPFIEHEETYRKVKRRGSSLVD